MNLSAEDKAFYELWKSGHRFIDQNEYDSLKHGVYSLQNGKVEGYTINGLKRLAENNKLRFKELGLLTPEELEIMFNHIKFQRTLI